MTQQGSSSDLGTEIPQGQQGRFILLAGCLPLAVISAVYLALWATGHAPRALLWLPWLMAGLIAAGAVWMSKTKYYVSPLAITVAVGGRPYARLKFSDITQVAAVPRNVNATVLVAGLDSKGRTIRLRVPASNYVDIAPVVDELNEEITRRPELVAAGDRAAWLDLNKRVEAARAM